MSDTPTYTYGDYKNAVSLANKIKETLANGKCGLNYCDGKNKLSEQQDFLCCDACARKKWDFGAAARASTASGDACDLKWQSHEKYYHCKMCQKPYIIANGAECNLCHTWICKNSSTCSTVCPRCCELICVKCLTLGCDDCGEIVCKKCVSPKCQAQGCKIMCCIDCLNNGISCDCV